MTQTKQWIDEIIVGLNFCPFAKKEVVNNAIHYHVSSAKKKKAAVSELMEQCRFLLNNPNIETGFVIYETSFASFEPFLFLVDDVNHEIAEYGFEGIFQIASFHPYYCFDDADFDDAANYTNRSPYPMLHIIREESMEKVLNVYKRPEDIPVNNIALARDKGTAFFEKVLRKIAHSS